MSITQQYLLDTYRARQHGDPTPPAPGAHDWQVMRELPDHRRFRAVLAGRPARGRGRVRAAWARLFTRPSGKADPTGPAAPTRPAGPVISGECAPRTP
ncbi:hypothetical protein C6Y14_42715 [Streptomyces dioscori]|uniref:Uncharacterized protein n=1 Tax=Streptomyces dioscori TaxID=2109333 RepID=A0A2P8PTJ7_9ACTN|nr:hypothetical protein C6Y14_42715 [Streptomyces dioscori]